MARVVLPIAGAVVGSFWGNPQLGWAIGSAIGNAVDPQVIKGPSIGEISQQTSQEGVPRPIVYALSPPIAGNIIATSEPRIVRKSQRQGKGGPKVETESVFRTYAVGVSEGPIDGEFVRVWRNGILVYDARSGVTADNTKFLQRARFFTGAWDQNPSPDLEAISGVGTTPAYRGTAYMVMADDDLTDMRGAIPQYVFQITGFFGDTVPLPSLVEALCERAGATQIDVSDIAGDVRGLTVTNAYPVYSALKSLSEVFLFDPSNYDGIIHFIPRGQNSVATITEDDMLDDEEDIEQEKRSDAIAIPRALHLNYNDVDGGLNTDKQTSERAGDRRSIGEVSLQTAVILNADEAARTVAINHKVLIEDQKGELKFSLPDSFLKLVPANPIIVQRQGKSERCRIAQADTQDGYQTYLCLRDRQSAYTSNIEGIPAAPQTPPPSSVVGATLIELLDIHILRDSDDPVGLGYYVAVSGLLDAWQGATVELSLDGGANYIEESTWTTASIMGETTTVLADHPQAYPDEINTVTVRIDTPNAELLETDLEGLLNRENLAIIGNEIIQFANANETSTEGEWELSYFLRGRKGTYTEEHPDGTRFVLLERSALAFIPADLVQLNRTLTFRATSFGTNTDNGTVVSMTFTGQSQTERAPAYLQARRDGSDVILSWQGVGRLGAGAQSAHGAYFLGYRVTITDGSLTQTYDTTEQSLTQDVSAFTGDLTISVQQRNHFTGLGPSIEVIV